MLKLLPDLFILCGVAAMSYGAWLVYEPAGFILAGALTFLIGIRAAK